MSSEIDLESMSIGKRDALLVFCTLCKMGVKEDTDEVTVKTRILSFEFLQGLLEGVSNSLTKNFHLIDSEKHTFPMLCYMKTSICCYYLQGNDTKAVRKGRRRGSRGGQAPDEVVNKLLNLSLHSAEEIECLHDYPSQV
ncbi:hypothetical protein SLE2022_082320 [Rubroshorea leprosula]